MRKSEISFEIPVQENLIRNKLYYSKPHGDVTVTVDRANDNEITGIEYGNVNILPLIKQLPSAAMDYFYNAVENHLEHLLIEAGIEEENREREVYS